MREAGGRSATGTPSATPPPTPPLAQSVPVWYGLAFVTPLTLYLRTLAPTVYNLDSAELTTAAATGGIVRPTGYPFYLMLGRAWSMLPLGDVGYRMNALSAVAGAGALFVASLVLRRLGIGGLATFGALGLLAVAPAYWSMSVVAEVYTLHCLLAAGLLLALLRWADRPDDARRALWPGLALGLAATHHASSILFVPGVLAFVGIAHPSVVRRPRVVAAAAAGFGFGLLPIAYLPLAHAAGPAFNYAGAYDGFGTFHALDLGKPANIAWLMSGRLFAGQMLGYSWGDFLVELWHGLVRLNRAFLAVGLGPGLVGAVVLLRRSRPIGAMLGLSAAANAIFFAGYRVVDKETMYVALFMIWAIWVAVGYEWLLRWLAERSGGRSGGGVPAIDGGGRIGGGGLRIDASTALGAVIVLAVGAGAVMTWPLADRSGDTSARDRGENVLAIVEPNALVVGWWDTVPVVEYLQLVEGARPDVRAINRFLIPQPALDELLAREIGRRPVYVDSLPPALADSVDATPAGPLLRLAPSRAAR